MLNRRLPFAVFLILAAVFAAGVTYVLQLRLEKGDAFPPFSTYRADPIGTRALYESFAVLPGFRVSRNFLPIERLRQPSGALLFLGFAPNRFIVSPRDEIRRFTEWTAQGNRVILSFAPLGRGQKLLDNAAAEQELDFDLASDKGLYFTGLGPQWKVLASKDNRAKIIARDYQSGSLILCADSYLFSNEAILKDRQTRLISQLIGDARNIVFDESHNGLRDQGSIGTLARRYRLHGVAAGLLLLAGLFLWQNMSPFLPLISSEDRLDSISGKDAASGLVKLLKRSVSADQVAVVCLAEWKKSSQLVERAGPSRLQQAEAQVRAQKDPVAAYRTIHQIFTERNRPQ